MTPQPETQRESAGHVMSSTGLITSLTVIFAADEATATAELYAGMCDQLAATIEDSAVAGTMPARLTVQRLAALHVELDELTARESTRAELVHLARQVNGLITFVCAQAGLVFEITATRLAELYGALVERVGLTESGGLA